MLEGWFPGAGRKCDRKADSEPSPVKKGWLYECECLGLQRSSSFLTTSMGLACNGHTVVTRLD